MLLPDPADDTKRMVWMAQNLVMIGPTDDNTGIKIIFQNPNGLVERSHSFVEWSIMFDVEGSNQMEMKELQEAVMRALIDLAMTDGETHPKILSSHTLE